MICSPQYISTYIYTYVYACIHQDKGQFKCKARAEALFAERYVRLSTDPERYGHAEGASAALEVMCVYICVCVCVCVIVGVCQYRS